MNRRAAPSPVICFLTIALFHLLSRAFGLRAALRIAQRQRPAVVQHDPAAQAGHAALVACTARHVSMAGAFYPARALCLEQSLALCVLLRRCGVAAELRIGVQSRPFQAHAWVEVDGCAVNENMEVTRAFTPLPLAEV